MLLSLPVTNNASSCGLQDIPMSRDQPSDQEFPYPFSEHSDGIRKPEEKVCLLILLLHEVF